MKYFKYLVATFFVCAFQLHAQENEFYEDAYQSFEEGKIDESYIYLKNSLNANPDHLPSKILMGQVLALSGIFDDAQAVLEEALFDGADANLIIETYARVLLIQRRYNQLLELELTNLTSNKKSFLLSAQASAHELLHDIDAARMTHKMALEEGSNSIGVLNGAANFFLKHGDPKYAYTLINRSLTINPTIANSFLLKADYYKQANDFDSRLKALQSGLKISPNHPIMLRDLVTAYSSVERFNDAKEVLESTIALSPNDPMAKLLLSWVLSNLGQDEVAKSTLDELVSNLSLIDSDNLNENDGMLMVSGLANLAANNIELARGQFEQYLTRNPTSFEATSLLVRVYRQEQNFVAASNLLEKHMGRVNEDPELMSQLCDLYIRSNQNFKCNNILDRMRKNYGSTDIFIQTESRLLSARGKLDLALDNLNKIKQPNLATAAQKALVAIRTNKLDIAMNQVNILQEFEAENPDFLNLEAAIYKKQNKDDKAEAVYRKILSNTPDHYSAKFNLASLLYGTRRFNEAERLMTSLLTQRPLDPDLLVLNGRILTRTNKIEQALDSLTKATTLRRNDLEAIEALVWLYINTNNYQAALSRANELLKSNSASVKYLKLRGSIYHQLGRVDDAWQDLKIVYGVISDQPEELYKLSIDQNAFGDYESALRTLQQALKLQYDDFFIQRDLAKTAITLNKVELAETTIKRLSEMSPNNPDVLILQADLFLIKKRLEEAAMYYDRALEQSNNAAQAMIGAYKLANEGIETERFVNRFEKLAALPRVNIFAVHLLADYYFNAKQFKKAKQHYISISSVSGYPPLPIVLNNLALIYLQDEEIDAAYNFAQQGYEILPNNANLLDTLGWITTLRGNHEQGLDLLRKSYAMNAQNPDLRYHIAHTLYKLGRVAESKRELQVLLSDFKGFEKENLAIELRNKLDNL